MEDVKAILLCAGRSLRMDPVEDKNFLQFLGKPLMGHQLENLAMQGIKHVVMVCGKHNLVRAHELAKELTKTQKVKGMKIEIVEQKKLDEGMAGGVLAASGVIKGGPVMIVSTNDIVDPRVYGALAARSKRNEGLILGMKVKKYFPGGYIKKAKDGTIAEIIEKPGEGKEPSSMVNVVVHRHPDAKKLFAELEREMSGSGAKADGAGRADGAYERALSRLMKSEKYEVFPYDGYWFPLKFPWHIFGAFEHFIHEAKKSSKPGRLLAHMAKTARVSGKVVFGKRVRVMDGAVIIGPAYIGDDSIIGNNALVRGSHIGAQCVVGFGSEVTRSFLGDGVWMHTNYIGDSIIGNNVSFGAGTVTGNLRLDEKTVPVSMSEKLYGERVDSGEKKLGLITGDDIRVGINVSFMPGVTVGSGSLVGPGIVVSQNIPRESFVTGEWTLKVKKNKLPRPERRSTKQMPSKPQNG